MSSDIAVKVDGLSKCYQIYDKPADRLLQTIYPRLQKLVGMQQRQYYRDFWAIRDVSFEVRKGETIGIIGRNGSGKSTLLQIICGTLCPTLGIVTTRGRIAALLELGSGFNPEFTGRENVYMNAAVLGLSKGEIDARFDDIAAFADIGEFIDQPVKTYSSGMMVRLAFAVQIFIDPEVLIIDEALAVGDVGFQYKCFQRLEDLRAKGVTILMVTHTSGNILEYADRCIVLDHGEIVENSVDVHRAVLRYEKNLMQCNRGHEGVKKSVNDTSMILCGHEDLRRLQEVQRNVDVNENRFGSGRAIIESLVISSGSQGKLEDQVVFKPNEEVAFVFCITSIDAIEDVVLGVSISRANGGDIWGDNNIFAKRPISLKPGRRVIEYRAKLPVCHGEYLVHAGLACFSELGSREELDQRRPVAKVVFAASGESVGVIHAPVDIIDWGEN